MSGITNVAAQAASTTRPNQAAFEAEMAAARRSLMDIEDGNAPAVPAGLRQAAAQAVAAIAHGAAGGATAVGHYAQQAGSAAYVYSGIVAHNIATGAQTAGTAIATTATAAGTAVVTSPSARILGLGLGASYATIAAGGGKLLPGLGAALGAGLVGVGIGSAVIGIAHGSNYYSAIAAGIATGLANGINVGIPKPQGFDDNALAIGGGLGVFVANGLRNGLTVAVAGSVGLGSHAAISKIVSDAKSNALPNNLQDIAPAPAANTTAIRGRGLTEVDSPEEQQSATGIYNASAAIWQSWMANPQAKAQIKEAAQTQAGARHIMTQLYRAGTAAYIKTQDQAQLAAFQKTDPAGYHDYIAKETAPDGPYSHYVQAANDFSQAYQSASALIAKDLQPYTAQNPNASLNDFYAQMSPQDKTTLQSYFQTMDTSYHASNAAGAQAAYDYLSASGQNTDPATFQHPAPYQGGGADGGL